MTVAALINLIIVLLIVGALLALVHYVITAIPIPDPAGRLIRIAATVVAVLAIILVLLQMLGVTPVVAIR
jgi:hypothetical protein